MVNQLQKLKAIYIKLFYGSLFIFLLIIISSCQKEGCTDPDGENYEAGIISKNTECEYQGSAVFWMNEATANSLQNEGVTSLNVSVDGENIGSFSVNNFSNRAPGCFQSNFPNFTKELGNNKKQTYSYSVKGQDGFEYWSGEVVLEAKKCNAIRINYLTFDENYTVSLGSGITDIDNNTYKTVVYGNGQEWMAENLRTSKYSNGEVIQNVENAEQWKSLTTGAWAYYENKVENNIAHGKLYNFYAVSDSRKLCPSGWKVATKNDWAELTSYLGGDATAGGSMKQTGTLFWSNPNVGANNKSLFNALASGQRTNRGIFNDMTYYSFWWNGSEYNEFNAWYTYLYFNFGNSFNNFLWKQYGFSVRCIKE